MEHTKLQALYYDQTFESGWQIDPETLKMSEGLKFVVLISPNNPTGQVLNASSLKTVSDFCLKYDLVLICDEVFDLFLYQEHKLLRPGALYPTLKTFTLNGISKRFASPDLKLAWTLISGPEPWTTEVANTLDLVNDAFLSTNSYTQFLLPSLFKKLEPFQKFLIESLKINGKILACWLKEHPGIACCLPQVGIHGLMRVKKLPLHWDDETFCMELLKTQHLAMHPGYYYEVQEPGCWLVFSLLKTATLFEEALERLGRFLSQYI